MSGKVSNALRNFIMPKHDDTKVDNKSNKKVNSKSPNNSRLENDLKKRLDVLNTENKQVLERIHKERVMNELSKMPPRMRLRVLQRMAIDKKRKQPIGIIHNLLRQK